MTETQLGDVPETLFIFDGDCGLCRASTLWLQRTFGLQGRTVPSAAVDLSILGLTASDVQRQAWFVGGREMYGGARAIAAWLRTGRRLPSILGTVLDWSIIRSFAAGVYWMVARNRRRIPGPWEKSCRL